MENFNQFQLTNSDFIFGGDIVVTWANDYYDTIRKRIIYLPEEN